jgi:hypothetical protein
MKQCMVRYAEGVTVVYETPFITSNAVLLCILYTVAFLAFLTFSNIHLYYFLLCLKNLVNLCTFDFCIIKAPDDGQIIGGRNM